MMERGDGRAGSIASFGCAALTLISMAVGVGIMQAMGAASGMDVARASPDAVAAAKPLLTVAELLKIGIGLCLAVSVAAVGLRWRTSPLATTIGYLGAAAVIVAGVLGLVAVSGSTLASARMGYVVGIAGLVSLPATGLWAAMAASGARPAGSKTLKLLGLLLGFAGCVAVLFPPAGLLFGLVSLAWWIVLGLKLRAGPR